MPRPIKAAAPVAAEPPCTQPLPLYATAAEKAEAWAAVVLSKVCVRAQARPAASIVASYSNNAHTFAFLLLQESRQDKTEAEEASRPATLIHGAVQLLIGCKD